MNLILPRDIDRIEWGISPPKRNLDPLGGMKMAKRKEGCGVAFIEVPLDLLARMKEIGRANQRSLNGEAVVAFEQHVRRHARTAGNGEGAKERTKGKARGRVG